MLTTGGVDHLPLTCVRPLPVAVNALQRQLSHGAMHIAPARLSVTRMPPEDQAHTR
jgi:hypothetical protein